MPEALLNCAYQDIQITAYKSRRKSWNGHIYNNLSRQLAGLNGLFQKEVTKNLILMDIRDKREANKRHDCESEKLVIPGAYQYCNEDNEERFCSLSRDVELAISNDTIKIYTGKHLTYSIPYLIHLLCLGEKKKFVHSAGVESAGDVTLICGHGGIGKTAFISRALEDRDMKVLGDDLNIIKKSGDIVSYNRPFCLYDYHKQLFPSYFENGRLKQSVSRKTKLNRLRRRLNLETGLSTNIDFNFLSVPAHDICGRANISSGGTLRKLIYIERTHSSSDEVSWNELSAVDAAKLLSDVMMTEWGAYLKDHIMFLTLRGESFLDYYKSYISVIEQGLKNASILKLRAPTRIQASDLNEIIVREVL